MGFSLWWPLLLSTGSRLTGFSSCGTWALLLCSMWNLPRPRIKPMSPKLAGEFFFFNWSCKTSENWSNTYAYPYLGESLVKDNSFLRETRMASKFLTTGPPGKSHFIPFYWQIRFLCINVPYFVYPFISWCTFGLLLLFWLLWVILLGTFMCNLLCGHVLVSPGYIPGSEIAGSDTNYI